MNALLQLSRYVGAIFAAILCIGIVTRSDIKLFEGQESSIISALIPADEKNAETDRHLPTQEWPTDYQRTESRRQIELPVRTARSAAVNHQRSTDNHSSRPKAKVDLEDWLELNLAQTFLEAEQETIAPGVILATGLYFLQEGQGDMSMNAADVADYLSEVRAHASPDAKQHMKYIANSESWFKGLKKAGFEGEQLARLFSRYQLAQYDQDMYRRFVSKQAEEEDYDRPSSSLSDEVAERNRSLAQAYNDYADRPEVRKKLGLPSIRAPRPMATTELSEGRREARSFAAGESRTYEDARRFWAVLKEMIALEADYDSWEAYHAAQPHSADQAFRERSNIMALGGVMKVTRKEGA
jgi:hypothetical protein